MDIKNEHRPGINCDRILTLHVSPLPLSREKKRNANFPSLGKGALLINAEAKNYASLACGSKRTQS
jgi:hypothetical protein